MNWCSQIELLLSSAQDGYFTTTLNDSQLGKRPVVNLIGGIFVKGESVSQPMIERTENGLFFHSSNSEKLMQH